MPLKLPLRRPSQREIEARIRKEPLGEFFTFWDDITEKDVAKFAAVLNKATCEREIQLHLQKRPGLLIRQLGGGHGRWVIPQKKLGSHFVADFLLGEQHSSGRDWYAVELESPKATMFTKAGDPSRTLSHAIRQIQNWRSWIGQNRDYARRPREEGGEGLTGITSELRGYVIIGRRSETDAATHELRQRMIQELRIEIRSYDWLLDAAAGNVDWFGTGLGRTERPSERA